MEPMSFSESHSWRLTEGEKNFWQKFALSISSIVLISLVMLQLFRRRWHKEDDKREERREELEMITLQNEVFTQDIKVLLDHIQEAHMEHCAEFQKQMVLLKKAMRKKETPSTNFQNMIDIVKMAKAGDGRCYKLQNQMDLLEKAMCVEDKRYAQIRKDIKALKLMMEKRLSDCLQSCSQEKDKVKKNLPISKALVCLVPLQMPKS
jgi:hypothetical protein